MIKGTTEAQAEIRKAAARNMEWFAPADRSQFLGEAALTAFALLLMNAFLAGMKEAAKDKAKQAGKKTFDFLWKAVTDLFSARGAPKTENPAGKELEKEAATAPEDLKKMTPAALVQLSAEIEKGLGSVLKQKLPPKDAEALAKDVRAAVMKHILEQRTAQ